MCVCVCFCFCFCCVVCGRVGAVFDLMYCGFFLLCFQDRVVCDSMYLLLLMCS